MYLFKTLENTRRFEILEAFLDAFSQYFVPFDPNPESHLKRWQEAGVDLSLSYGAFAGPKLKALVLMVPQGKEVFNLATGVIPADRGQRLTQQLFKHLIPEIKARGFETMSLEVIEQNAAAIRVYQQSGFKMSRQLLSFKGPIALSNDLVSREFVYNVKEFLPSEEHRRLMNALPSFEQRFEILARRKQSLEIHELKINGELCAYAIFHPLNMNLIQLSGKDSAFMNQLLSLMKLDGESVGIINVDEANAELQTFLKSVGLKVYLSQYEMKRSL